MKEKLPFKNIPKLQAKKFKRLKREKTKQMLRKVWSYFTQRKASDAKH